MITELITYLSTYFHSKISPEARAFGHLYESIALVQREKRCASYWLSHRTMCKDFIQSESKKLSETKKVLILGSGPLHEIPVDFLAKTFERVDLVDIVHLPETIKQWQHLKNLHFITADITEIEKDLMAEKKPANKIPAAFLNENYSLVISANLLSQLAYHLRNFLEKKSSPRMTESELDLFANKVTENHYRYLQKFHCPVLLITDIETHLIDKQGNTVQKETPYIDFSFPIPVIEWWWNVAPIPEYSRDLAVKMKVAGFVLNV